MNRRHAARIKKGKRTFFERLAILGYAGYTDYLTSEHWRRFKAEYFGSARPRRCVICGSEDGIQLHHVTYKRLGDERLSDVVPVCGTHHAAIHRRSGTPIGKATTQAVQRAERQRQKRAA